MKTYTYKTYNEPTIFNKEMVIGLLIAAIPGAIIGGFIGKSRIKQENAAGKVVSDEPSIWNKDLVLGALLGSALLGIGGLILGPVGMVAGSVAGMVIGGYIGGGQGQQTEAQQFLLAKNQAAQEAIAAAVAKQPTVAVEPTIAPEKSFVQGLNDRANAPKTAGISK
jgi:hypothetical protein